VRILAAIAVASLLAACQTTSIGANWGPNTRDASRVSFDGDDSIITSREWKRREAGTQERLRFKNGASLYFEELYGGMSVWAFRDDKESIRGIYDNAFGKHGNYQPGEIVMRPFNDYKLFHMSAQSETQKCFLGEGTSTKDRGGWHYVMTMCRHLRDTTGVARLDADAIDVIARLRFDGGELNKMKSAMQVPPAGAKN
jgi:hypothetical protein